MPLNKKIKELRKERNMSQEELAELIDVTRQAVTKWERGASSPDMKHLIQIATIFNVPIEKIIDNKQTGIYTVSGNEICSYCGKKAEFYKDESLTEAYCSPKCQQLHTIAMNNIKKNMKCFGIGIIISVLLLLSGVFFNLAADKNLIVGSGIILLGITLILFPFCTPESYKKYGYIKTTRIGRILGFITEMFGLMILFLG